MATITIEGRDGRQAPPFEGELLIPPVTTYSDEKSRWVEFRLYAKDEGGFVVHRTGMSLVYHEADTGCRTRDGRVNGFDKLAEDLPEDAEPCETCNPPWPDDLPHGRVVRFEEPRHTISHCATALDAVNVLTWDPKHRSRIWSDPVSELVLSAAKVSSEFAAIPVAAQTIKL